MNIRPRRRTTPPIPIVALVDILVIVLLFIVATTSFRKRQTHMQITVPQAKGLGETTAPKEASVAIAVTKDEKIFLDGHELAEPALADALKELKKAKPDAKLELNADGKISLDLTVKIWDDLKAAGYPTIPLRVQRPGAAK